MASQFSSNGKYFAQLSNEGILKIWNILTGKLEQEFIADYHLTCPCTCLQFVEAQTGVNKDSHSKKRKRRESVNLSEEYIVLGTNSGLVLVYSIANANVAFQISTNTNKHISCITGLNGSIIYTGIDQSIYSLDLERKNVQDKWRCGNDNIKAIKEIPNGKLLVASKSIKLWDVESMQVLRTFIGHSSDVCILEYIKPLYNSYGYFVTGSKGDRLLSCWALNSESDEQTAIATFLMDDVANSIAIYNNSNEITNFVALTRGGMLHFYQHTLNGKCKNPLKPKTTIHIASDPGKTKKEVVPIPIVGAVFQEDLILTVCYGNSLLLIFENVTIKTKEKVQCLVRSDTIQVSKQNASSKVRQPTVNDNVQYLTPHVTTSNAVKRKSDGKCEVSMELRLENLTLSRDDSKVPKVDNLAQLLVQGIHSKDKQILKNVLTKQDETLIHNTVKRLPINVIGPLLQELAELFQKKTLMCSIASMWLKKILQTHAGILISNPQLQELLDPIISSIESRLLLQSSLSKLSGRLDLLMSQVNGTSTQDEIASDEPLLTFIDKDTSEEDVSEHDSDNFSEHDSDNISEHDSENLSEDGDF